MNSLFSPPKGLMLYRPNCFLPWHITEEAIIELNSLFCVNKVTDNYYIANACVFQPDFCCSIGFHLNQNRVIKIELFRNKQFNITTDNEYAYHEFQSQLVRYFGHPHISYFFGHTWIYNQIKVRHYMLDRFGPEEHVEIHIRTQGRKNTGDASLS